MRSSLRTVSAVALVLGLATIGVGIGPTAAHADDPTWAQVQAAKKNVKQSSCLTCTAIFFPRKKFSITILVSEPIWKQAT